MQIFFEQKNGESSLLFVHIASCDEINKIFKVINARKKNRDICIYIENPRNKMMNVVDGENWRLIISMSCLTNWFSREGTILHSLLETYIHSFYYLRGFSLKVYVSSISKFCI